MKIDDQTSHEELKNVLPLWVWFVPLPIFFAASHLSAIYEISDGAAFIYLPTALGIILVNWWGPARVLPAIYVNAVLSGYLWGIDPWYLRPIFALPEVAFIFMSWYFFTKKTGGKFWLPDTQNLNAFLIWGNIVPLILTILFLRLLLYVFVGESALEVSEQGILGWLREFMTNFGLALPVFYFISPIMSRLGLLTFHIDFAGYKPGISSKDKIQVAVVYVLIFIMSTYIGLERYWFVYGIFSLWFALRFGFGLAVLTNLFIFMLAYIIPVVREISFAGSYTVDSILVSIYLGTGLLFVFSAITGRVIDDVKFARRQITQQVMKLEKANGELKVANKELDHFVYSVSHDLAAPLKSVKGLVSLSKLTEDPKEHEIYFGKIADSVNRLELFIAEVLDFSKVKRVESNYQLIDVPELVMGIIDDLRYMDGFESVDMDVSGLSVTEIISDKTSIKVIMANLIGNAISYRKKALNAQSRVMISSQRKGNEVFLTVADNGEGIKPEIVKKIFDMFYRGSTASRGSGLGLYIASEAAAKVKGKITVETEYGKGTTFTVRLNTVNK